MRAAAENAGIGVSSFARIATTKAAALRPEPAPKSRGDALARALAAYVGQVSAIGNNVNQIAHAANRGIPVDATALNACREALSRLRADVLAAAAKA